MCGKRGSGPHGPASRIERALRRRSFQFLVLSFQETGETAGDCHRSVPINDRRYGW